MVMLHKNLPKCLSVKHTSDRKDSSGYAAELDNILKVTSLQSEMSLVNGKQKIYRTRFRSMIITIRAPSIVAETHVTKMQTKEEVLCFKFVVHWLKILPTSLTV